MISAIIRTRVPDTHCSIVTCARYRAVNSIAEKLKGHLP